MSHFIQIPELAELVNLLKTMPKQIGTAESCTGGMLAQYLTALAGSSAWFQQGYVTYSNASKHQALGVSLETLSRYGAVSLETASEMAKGVLVNNPALDLAVSTTGIAGPDGGTPLKPVGTVCFGLAFRQEGDIKQSAEIQLFKGDRDIIRLQATRYALKLLANGLSSIVNPL